MPVILGPDLLNAAQRGHQPPAEHREAGRLHAVLACRPI
jgi:hypothetical protein